MLWLDEQGDLGPVYGRQWRSWPARDGSTIDQIALLMERLRSDPDSRRKQELSEQDVMQVLARMRHQYKIDDSRIYLMGHSMGAIGTWVLGAKYADTWAALGAFSGLGNPQSVERMKHIPQFVVHGDADPTVPVAGSRAMVAALKTAGVDHVYVEVPGGNHIDVVVPNLPAMFEFFNSKRKGAVTTQQ